MEFKELGLTQNEAKVYEMLLKNGSSTASNLSQKSTVPYGRIYTVLESLEQKNLVRVISGDTKKYIASDPIMLQEIIDSKIKNLMNVNDEIKNYKKLFDENTKESVVISKGKNNFTKIIRELKKPQKTNYSIKYEITQEFIRENKKADKNIDIKIMSHSSKEFNITGKRIDNEGIAMSIIDDEEVMIALIKSNTTLLIRDKPFAKIMKELFIKYYLQAEPLVDDSKKNKDN